MPDFWGDKRNALYRSQSEIQKMTRDGHVQFFYVDGGVEVEKRRRDPLLMQNDLINTAKITYEYLGIERMVTTARWSKFSTIYDFDRDNEHYEVGIFKTLYRLRPSKSLEISPMFKYTIRNGFRMAEDRIEYLPLTAEIDGEEVSRGLRLREIEQTYVQDMTPALIPQSRSISSRKPLNSRVVAKSSCSMICLRTITILSAKHC